MNRDESAHTCVERSDLPLAFDVEETVVKNDGKAQDNCQWSTVFWILLKCPSSIRFFASFISSVHCNMLARLCNFCISFL